MFTHKGTQQEEKKIGEDRHKHRETGTERGGEETHTERGRDRQKQTQDTEKQK